MESSLSRKTIYGFATGDFTFNLLMSMAVNYYLAFLTEVAGLSAGTTGMMLLIARICDAISVVVTGMLIHKMYFKRFGKYRTWIICVAPLTAVFFITMFSNPSLGTGAKALFLGFFYVCAHCCVNFVYNAHMGLVPVMSKSPADAIALSAKKMQFTTASQVVFGLFSMPIILFLAGGGANMARGYQLAVVLFAILSVVGYWTVAAVSKPYDIYGKPDGADIHASSGGEAASVLKNKPLLIIIAADSFKWLAAFSVLSIATHYCIYVVQSIEQVGIIFTSVGLAGFFGTILGQALAKTLPKKTLYIIGCVGAIATYIVARIVAFQFIPFVICISLGALSIGLSNTIGIAMYSDCSEYWAIKSGKNATAFIMSMYAMPIKIGVALAGAITGFSLELVHYVPNMQPTAEIAMGIANISTFLPIGGCILMLLFGFLYPLTDKRVDEMRSTGTV